MNNYLTETDRKIITDWIVEHCCNCEPSDINIKALENNWIFAKSHHLFKFMGGELIKKFPLIGSQKIDPMPFLKKLHTLRNKLLSSELLKILYEDRYRTPSNGYFEYCSIINNLTYIDTFINHKLSKKIDVNETHFHLNEKWTKAIYKLVKILPFPADTYNKIIKLIEDLRIDYSMAKQRAATDKYTLVFSIHPMDYFTMSDNNCNWNSCMSWDHNGDYHAGTVEMCNSPTAIVVYIEGGNPLPSWNSKAWRELFIIDKSATLNVYPYPYANKEYERQAFKIIRKLAKENLGWEYSNDKLDENYKFLADTDYMYNDIEQKGGQTIYPSLDILNNLDEKYFINNPITFSGESVCVMCGKHSIYSADAHLCEECLIKTSNIPIGYCYNCGTSIYEDDCYIISESTNHCFCEHCMNDCSIFCDKCGLKVIIDDTITIIDSKDNSSYLDICPDCFHEYEAKGIVYQNEFKEWIYDKDKFNLE